MALVFAAALVSACGGSEPTPVVPEVTTEPAPAAPSPSDTTTAANPPPEGAEKPEANPAASTSASPKPDDAAKAEKPKGAPPDAMTSATSAAKSYDLEGKLTSRTGSILVIEVPGASPTPGTKGVLYRHFEQDIGPLHTTGWLAIADVTVKDSKDGKIRLDLVAEKSTILLNGKKVDHFKSGNVIKLELSK